MRKPSLESVSRLPKWAQEYVNHLEMEGEAARRVVRKLEGEQTPGRIWVEHFECMGEDSGPTTTKQYVPARSVSFEVGKQYIEVAYDNHGRLVARTGGPRLLLRCEVSNSIQLDLEAD